MADIKQIQVGDTKYNISGALIVLEDNGTTTAGTWLAKTDQINSLVDGQLFLYKVTIAGGTSTNGTTLNITGSSGTALGAKPIYRTGTTKLTTQYAVGHYIILAYNTSGTCFRVVNDSDANSTSYLSSTPSSSTAKNYLIGKTVTTASGSNYYNANVYMQNGKLYSNGNEVLTSNAVSSVNSKTGAVVLADSDIGTSTGSFTNLHNVAERVNDLSNDFVYAHSQYNAKYAIKPVSSDGHIHTDALLYTDADDGFFKFDTLDTGFIYTYKDEDDHRRFDYVPFTNVDGGGVFYNGASGRDFKLLSTSDLRTKINGHTGTQIEASAGTPTLTLSANTTYKLDAGGDYFIFKTPADTNTNYYSKPNYTSSNGIKIATGYSGSSTSTTYDLYAPKATTSQAGVLKIGTTASDAAAGNHTHDNVLIIKGTLAGSSSTTYGTLTPAASKGDIYQITTSGKINGKYYYNKDMLLCTTTTAAATSSNYTTIRNNWTFIASAADTPVIRLDSWNSTLGTLVLKINN